MSQKGLLATAIKSLKYAELIDIASDLVKMQISAKEGGWRWRPDQLHGEYGMAQMLHSWAEEYEDE